MVLILWNKMDYFSIFQLFITILDVCKYSDALSNPQVSSKDPSMTVTRGQEHSTTATFNALPDANKTGLDEEEAKRSTTIEISGAPSLNESFIPVIRKAKTKASFRCKGADCSQANTHTPMVFICSLHPFFVSIVIENS